MPGMRGCGKCRGLEVALDRLVDEVIHYLSVQGCDCGERIIPGPCYHERSADDALRSAMHKADRALGRSRTLMADTVVEEGEDG